MKIELTKVLSVYNLPFVEPSNLDLHSMKQTRRNSWLWYIGSIAQSVYTLSHLVNDRDVSAYSGGRRLSSRTQLLCFLTRSKRNPEIDAQMMPLAAYFLWRDQWRHGRSRGEEKYRRSGCNILSTCTIPYHYIFSMETLKESMNTYTVIEENGRVF